MQREGDSMKKSAKLLCGAILISALLFLVSCGGTRVVFDIGDATLVSGELKQTYKDGVTIVPPEITKEGYVLVGWDGNYENPTEATTVTPVWKKLHTVTFDLDGGTAKDSEALVQSVLDGEAAEAPAVSKEGYAFTGWSRDFSAVTEDLTVTAVWTPVHTVTFDLAGGTQEDDTPLVQTVKDGEAASLPSVSREKYDFVKWDTDVSAVTGDLTVKAVWERKVLSASEIFKEISPGTVEINTYRLNGIHFSTGSGFFISEDGKAVTNYHVIENARKIEVTLSDGTVYEVKEIVSYSKALDVAVLLVDTKGNTVPYLELSDEKPEVGDAAYALGSSLGLTGTFSSGIISYVDRSIEEAPGVSFIQSTAPISQGNSGGPLVDEHGLVIGINSASYTEGQNLNLAIEISQIKGLSEVDLTPEELFQREGTLKWFIGEKPVSETSTSFDGQLLENGDTVSSVISTRDDRDVYFVKLPEQEQAAVMVMVKVDSLDTFEQMYLLPMISRSPDLNTAAAITEEYYQGTVIVDEDGNYYFVLLIYLSPDYTGYGDYIGLAFGADLRVEYDMFVLVMSEEEILAL